MARPEDEDRIPAPAEIGGTGDRVTITAPEPDEDADETQDTEVAAAPRPGETQAQAAERARDDRGRFAEGRPKTRREKRDPYRVPNQELQALREQVGRIPEMLRSQEQNFRAELERIRSAAQPAAAAAPADPISEVDAQMDREMQLMQAHDPANGRFDLTRWNQLNRKKQELIADARVEAALKKREGQQRQAPQDDGIPPHYRVRWDHLTAEYPELKTHPSFSKMVRHERAKLLAAGRDDTEATDFEATARVAAELGIRNRQPARGNERVAVRRQGPPGGYEGAGGQQRPHSVEVPRAMLQGLNLPEENIRRATFGDYNDR
ncbi:MAG TPA: hypothetical protein VFS51_02945 [Gemmatimonadales bacterium]|nr:hypothetical protein [Gemmatimonadales bacterium]